MLFYSEWKKMPQNERREKLIKCIKSETPVEGLVWSEAESSNEYFTIVDRQALWDDVDTVLSVFTIGDENYYGIYFEPGNNIYADYYKNQFAIKVKKVQITIDRWRAR